MSETESKRRRRWSAACALAVGGLALMVLWCWLAGVSDLLSFDPRHIPTAPSTALMFLLLALVRLALRRQPVSRWVVWGGYGVAGLATFFGALALLRPWLGWGSPLEESLAQGINPIGHIPLGQMSPVTGALFVVTGFALLLRLPPQGRRAGVCWIATLLALLITGLGACAAVSYGAGQPWLYGSGLIPMALPTALAFCFLGFALLLLPAPARPGQPPPKPSPVHDLTWPLMALVVLLLGTISASYLRNEQAQRRTDVFNLLKSIGGLKADQIAHWRGDYWQEAWLFSQASYIGNDVEDFLSNPNAVPARDKLRFRFGRYLGDDRFTIAALFDTNFVPRLVQPETPDNLPEITADLRARLLRERRLLLTDLHFTAATNNPHMDLVFPVFPTGAAPGTKLPPLGYIYLRAEAAHGLDQILRAWAIPSRSSETLLVRRESNTVVFLNELRHQTNTALRLCLPLDPQSKVPAALAVLGKTGTVEGVDYRGVPVFADTRAVPDSPWFIVSKMDRDELLAPLRRQAWLTLLLMLALTGLTGVALWLVRKQREVQRINSDLALERERRVLAERLEHLMKSANDIILIADEHWRIIEANDRAVQAYGYTLAELQRMKLAELRPPATLADFVLQSARLETNGHTTFETIHQRKDGTTFPIEVSARNVVSGGVTYRLGILRDITERKAHEREIARLTRLYATLSQINECLVHVTSRGELFREVCRITGEYSGFQLAWIGWLDQATHEVVPVGRAGDDHGYLDKIKVYADDRPEGNGPIGACIRAGRTFLSNNFLEDPRALPWRAAAVAHGLRAVAALPLRFQGTVCGALAVYADEPDVFKDKEVALLEEAALDISFALDNLETAAQRALAEAALHASEARFEQMANSIEDVLYGVDGQSGEFLYVSPAFERLLGYSLADITAAGGRDKFLAQVIQEDQFALQQALFLKMQRELLASQPGRWESWWRCKDGSLKCLEDRWFPVFEDKRLSSTYGVLRDVTVRRQAEEELRKRNAELERFNRASTGRELRMIELKQQVNKLHLQLGLPPPYLLEFDKPPPPHG